MRAGDRLSPSMAGRRGRGVPTDCGDRGVLEWPRLAWPTGLPSGEAARVVVPGGHDIAPLFKPAAVIRRGSSSVWVSLMESVDLLLKHRRRIQGCGGLPCSFLDTVAFPVDKVLQLDL